MLRLTRRYGFAATHRLYSPAFSDERNAEVFGKCANPWGHGHNYEVEITVRGPVDPATGRVVDHGALDELARREILDPFRHRNLNEEVPAFREAVPTTENLAEEARRRLTAAWPVAFPHGPALEKIRIRETPRNICDIWVQ